MEKLMQATQPQPETTAASRAPRRTLLILSLFAFALVTTIMAVRFARDYGHRRGSVYSGDYISAYKDASIWYEVGQQVLRGEAVWREDFRYPPTFAVLVAPLAALPSPVYYFVWYLLNVLLFGPLVWLAVRLVQPVGAPPDSRLVWLPALLVFAFALDNWMLGQTNVLMTALLYWSFWELAQGREARAGAVLGASVAIKVFTFPLFAYLLFRRRWAALAVTLVSLALFLFVIPAPVRGFTRNATEVTNWANRVVAPYLTQGKAGDWGQHALDYENQCLQATLHRLLRRVDAHVLAQSKQPLFVNIADLSEREVNLAVLASFLALVVVFVWACGWNRSPDPRQFALEASLAAIGLPLVSGLAWPYFFIALLLPEAVAVALLHQQALLRTRTRRLLLAALWIQGLGVVSLAVPYIRALGGVCWASVALYLALAVACREMREQERHSPAAGES